MLFSQLSLKQSSLKALDKMGFEKPTDIQSKAIPVLLGHDGDFVGQAQTGTGKTAAFALPLLEKINSQSREIEAIIIAPTRELANQIHQEIQRISQFDSIRAFSVYGGVALGSQIREIKKNRPQIIVGTPGRVLDLIERGVLKLETCKFAILDEADEMLDMGFLEDVEKILSTIESKQTWMFSATMPAPIRALVKKQFNNPEFVKVEGKELTANTIKQFYALVHSRSQSEALKRYLDYAQNMYGIIFCRTKIQTKELASELNLMGHTADALHGDMAQEQRDITMKNFKQRKVRLLVCTDVAARGIDVNDLTHVINYSLPQDIEAYVHRIGRTGRGGKTGVSLSIITPEEESRLSIIERMTKAKIQLMKIPTVGEIKKSILDKTIDEFLQDLMVADKIDQKDVDYLAQSLESFDKAELIRGIISAAFTRKLRFYESARSLDLKPRQQNNKQGRSQRASGRSSTSQFVISVGRNQGVTSPGDIIRLVCRQSSLQGNDIGRISLQENHSFFEVPENMKGRLNEIAVLNFQGQEVRLKESSSRRPRTGGQRRSSSPMRRSKSKTDGFARP